MKSLLLALLTANAVVGAWLLLSGPLGVTREPQRMELQIAPNDLRVLNEADLARLRTQAERAAAASTPSPTPKPEPVPVETPSLACVEIGNFPSEASAKKARARLAAIGLSERTTLTTAAHATRLRVTGVDAATEARIDEILKDYPKQQLEHCKQAVGAR
ncbi:MAG TPA: hypothetical protein VED47_02800 [Burkholderiaceae bacterium]|nr:hypothetical protein [Burkholderiaceae bacterium]